MKKIEDMISYYEEHATHRYDDYIIAHLRLINDLYENTIESIDDQMFVDKMITAFCDILDDVNSVNLRFILLYTFFEKSQVFCLKLLEILPYAW